MVYFTFLDQGTLYKWLAIFLLHQGSSDVLFGFTFLFHHYISPASLHYSVLYFCNWIIYMLYKRRGWYVKVCKNVTSLSLLPLVLQPAVEAFFLVHATERESKPPVRDTRESQLAHIKDEPPPLSPAPLTPATPSSLDPFFSREPSSMHISSSLPPDTQKFLRFAGTENS